MRFRRQRRVRRPSHKLPSALNGLGPWQPAFERLEPRILLAAQSPTDDVAPPPLALGVAGPADDDSSGGTTSDGSSGGQATPNIPGGSWIPLANLPQAATGTMMLLTDGTVIAQAAGISNVWYKLTPNATGSYVNGTWSTIAPMNTSRLYFASNVLTNGDVIVQGGEYSNGSQNWTNTGEIYDPVANTWTPIATYPQSQYGDVPSELLPDGNVLFGSLSTGNTYIYDPTSNAWTQAQTKLSGDRSDEETWVDLPDGSILSYNIFSDAQGSQRYYPSTNTWVNSGNVPVTLQTTAAELGPGLLLPTGQVFLVGGTDNTAVYTPPGNSTATGTWTAGPTIPGGLGGNDSPGAILPNGQVLFTAGSTPSWTDGTTVNDYDPTTNTITQITAAGPNLNTLVYTSRMLMLPSGQMLFQSGANSQLYVYQPATGPNAAWAPAVSNIVSNGGNTYTLTGTQLTGLSEGASYGDDAEMSSNYPIIELTNGAGNVTFGTTFNWTPGVATGSTPQTVQFSVPSNLAAGSYQLTVVTNGIPSSPVTFNVGFGVQATTPAVGALINTQPTAFIVQFNAAVDPSTLAPGNFTVNGVAASSYTYSAGTPNTVTYNFASTPVTSQGLQTMNMAAGSVDEQETETPLAAFSGTFSFQAVPMQVTSVVPTSGSTVELPMTSITIGFNEPYAPSSLSTGNLIVSQGTVTGYTAIDSEHVEYTISGVTQEGTLNFSMAAGSLTDAYGDPGPTHSGSYSLDYGTVAYPLPLTSVAPAGSLVYDPTVSGSIAPAGDTDSFTLPLNAGTMLSVAANPASGLQPRIDVSGPAGTASALSAALGQAALLQNFAISVAGTYTITISGLNGSTGGYTVQAVVNAAIQNSASPDSSLATAQDITASFISLGGAASRGAVVGSLQPTLGPVVASDTFDTDTLGPAWQTYSSDQYGLIQLTNAYGTDGTNYALFMQRTVPGPDTLNEAIWTVNLAGATGAVLSFDHSSGDDDGDDSPDNFDGPFASHQFADGVAISADGVHWYPVWDASEQTAKGWQQATVDIGAAAAAAGIPLTSNFLIEFQDDNDNTIGGDGGLGWDNMVVNTATPAQNWYSFNLTAGETVTVAAKGSAGAVGIGLYDANGDLLASGSSSSNANTDQSINNFTATTTGTYYVQVQGSVATSYALVVTQNADFDNQANGSQASAQKIGSQQVSGQQTVLGAILAAGDTNEYAVQLAGGATLSASTATPDTGSGMPGNQLNPEIVVYNSLGAIVASDDNSAADGINAQLTYQVPAGAGGNYFIQVLASPLTSQPTTGEYVLSVGGATINHAPALNTSVAPTLPTISENTNGGAGVLVSAVLATGAGGNPISDSDPGALQGIAITAADDTDGSWQFSTDGGSTWSAFPIVGSSSSLLLASDANTRIRYVPASGYSGTITDALSFRAWDQTAGTSGQTIDTGVVGGATAFSTGLLTAPLTVSALAASPVLSGANALLAQIVNNANSGGTLISTIVAGQISDSNVGAQPGIAVIGADTANGSWQYSISGASGPWLALGAVSGSNARLLAANANTLVRFVPNAGYTGTDTAALTFLAWDQTDGNTNGSLVNPGPASGPSAYSAASASASLTVTLPGDTRSWIGGGPDNNWSDGANWVGGVAPSANDALVFPTAALSYTSVDDFAAGTQFGSITIVGSGYAITGNGITLLDGLVDSANGADSFTVPITMAAAQTIINGNASSTLTLGNIDTGLLQTLTFDGSGTTSVTGVISDSGGLTKDGAGTLILSGPNTYLGLTSIVQGVLLAENNTALGSASAGTNVTDGAALQVEGGVTIAEPLTIGGAGLGVGTPGGGLPYTGTGELLSVSGSNAWTGAIDLSGTTTIGVNTGSELNVSGSIIGLYAPSTTGLVKAGGGQLDLTGSTPNQIDGAVSVAQGTLFLDKSGGTAIQGNLSIGDNIEGNDVSVVRLGASNQIPQVDPTGGTLLGVTLLSSGLLDLNGYSDTIGSLAVIAGQTYSANITTGTGVLTLGGTLTANEANGTSAASPPATISGFLNLGSLSGFSGGTAANTTRTFQINGSTGRGDLESTLTISAVISGVAGTSLTKAGAGTLTLTGNNTYAGTTFLTGGLTEIGSGTALGSGTVVINATTIDAVGGPQIIANPIEIDGTAAYFWGSNNLTFSGPTMLTGNRSFYVLDAGQTVTFSGGIGEGVFNGSSLTKFGPGTLALTGANTYSGQTTVGVGGGTLDLGSSGTLLNSSSITVNDQATFKLDNSTTYVSSRISPLAPITLSGGTLDFVGAANTASSESIGAVTLLAGHTSTIESDQASGGTATLTLASLATASGATVSFIGTGSALSASGSNQILVAISPGSLTNGILPYATVTGPSSLDLATYVTNASGVAITALPAADYVTSLAAAGPTSNVKLSSPGSYTSNGATINALLISGSGVTVGGVNDSLTVSSGAVIFAGGGTDTMAVGRLNLGAQALITADSGSTATISGVVTGAGTSLTKAGTGTVVLSGANQFAGSDYINQGILDIENSAALGATSSSVTVNQGASLALQDPGSSPVNVGTMPLTIWGTGFNDAGALENISGNSNSWAGTIAMGSVTLDATTIISDWGQTLIGATFIGSAAGQLSLTGLISGAAAPVKVGGGTLAFGGVLSNTFSGSTIVEQGTLLLDKAAGLSALTPVGGGGAYVGNDLPSATPAQLVLGANNQIPDADAIFVNSTGTLNFNNYSDVISSLTLTIGPNGSSTVETGSGMLTLGGSVTVQTIGTGNPAPATISGNLALNPFSATAAVTRTFTVNDGAVGDDLVISAAISDGNGIFNGSIIKMGLGTLQFTGSTANTYTGSTTINEGTLELNKTPGVNALSGPLTIGEGGLGAGGANSQVVRLLASNQINGALPVFVNSTGLLDLNGFSDTIGTGPGVAALTINSGNVSTGAGTLTLNGDVTETTNSTNNIVSPGTISGNLNLGAVSRTFTINHYAGLPYDLIISANISGAAGVDLNKAGTGNLLLSGNNTYAGNTYLSASASGEIAVGSDTALGTGALYLSGNSLLADSGPHVISNTVYLSGTTTLTGANSLTFSGPANLTAGTTIAVTNATSVTFSGGIGETQTTLGLTKTGNGFLYLTGQNTYDGPTVVSGGWLVLKGAGTLINSSSFTVNANATLRIDNNSAGNLSDRINDNGTITVNGGTLLYIGASGAASSETIGQLTLGGSASSTVISQAGAGSGSSVALTFGQLTRAQLGAVQFVGAGTSLGATNQILFTAAPTETGSGASAILPYATVISSAGQVDLATLSGNALVAFTNYATGNINSAAAGSVYLLDGNLSPSPQTLTTSTSLNAVFIRGSGLVLTGNSGVTLNLASGALVSAGGSGNTISVPTLDFGAVEGVIDTAASLTISSTITGTSLIGITKAGSGMLTLSGTSPNTYSGQTIVTQGVLNSQKSGALGAATAATAVQTVTIGNAIGGNFKLNFNGQATTTIAYNASAATVQSDLDALSTIGGVSGSVTVTDPNPSANPNVYTITFGGSLAGVVEPAMTPVNTLSYLLTAPATTVVSVVNPGGLAGSGTTVVSGAALQLSDSSTDTGEQLTLSGTGLASTGALHGDGSTNAWNGPVVLSGAVTVNVDSGGQLSIGDAISSANTLTKVGPGTLQYTGVNPNTYNGTVVNGGTLVLDKTAGATAITGSLTIGNDVGAGSGVVQVAAAEQINSGSTVTISSTGVLQLLSSVATSTTQAEQTVTVAGSSGTFTLGFGNQATSTIAFNATPATVQSDLDSLSTIGGAGGSVSVTGTPGAYVVLFTGSMTGAAEPAMTISKGSGISSASVQVISAGGATGSQTITGLSTQVGISASSTVLLASGTTLAFGGTLTTNSGIAGTSAASPSVTISGGDLALAPQGASGVRSFEINDSPVWNDLLITSTITDGIAGAASGFIKAGGGRMVLDPTSGSNTFSAGVTVSSGELNLQQAGALVDVSGTGVGGGAALELQSANITTSGTLTLNGTGINNSGALVDVSGNDSWTGNVLVSSATNVGVVSGATLTLSGVISGLFGLTKILPGTLVFGGSSANTNTGTTTVSEGTLLLSKPTGVDAIAASGSLVVGNDAGGPDSDLVQLTASSEIDPAASVTIDTTGQLDLNGFNQTLAGVTMEFGPTQSAALTTESGTLSLTGNATFSAIGTTFVASPAAAISGNLALGSTTHTFTVNAGTSLDNAQISATITGSGAVTKAGAGTLLLSNNNTAGWSSSITLDGGTVDLGNSGGLGTGTLTVSAGTTLRGEGTAITLANNITFGGVFTLTIGGTQNFTLNDTLTGYASGTSTLSVTSAGNTSVGNIATAAGEYFFVDTNFYSNATLAGTVSGSGYLEKASFGLLTVGPTGLINLTTDVFIFAGVLAVSSSSAINSAANIEPSSNGALDISGNQTFTNKLTLYNNSTIDSGAAGFLTGALRSTSGTNTWSGNVVLAGSSAAVNYIDVDIGQLTLTGIISESATDSGLAKVGAGMLVLGGSSSNTFTGTTTVDQGTLQLNKSGTANAIGTGGVTVGDSGGGHDADVLQFGPAAGTAEILATASVTVANSGLLDLATYSASATLDNLTLVTAPISSADVQTGNGVLTFGSNSFVTVNSWGSTDGTSPAAAISGKLVLSSSAVFTVDSSLVPSSSDDLVISAAISGSSSATFLITGGGTLALTGANNYTGQTIVRGSTLALSGAGTDPDTLMAIESGGTLLIDNQSAGNVDNRLGSSVGINLIGGTFSYLGAPGIASSESIGQLQVTGSDSVVESTVSTMSGSSVTITASSINEGGASGIFRFAGIGADLGSSSNQLLFTTPPTLTAGNTIPDAVLQDSAGLDFASYGASGIAPASYVTSLAGAGPTSNVKLSTNQTLSTSQSVNAILFVGPNVTVGVGGNTLTVASGAVATEAAGDAITGGTLALGAEGVFDAESGDSLAVSSSITGPSGLIKSGAGTLTLTGSNSYSSATWINFGVVNVQNSQALGPSGNTTTVASGAGLELQGGISVAGSLALAGTGPGNNGAGALRNVSGTNSWVGTVTSSAGADVGVTSGQLTISGQVTSGALVEVGSGILQLAGSTANTDLNLTVNSGTLELNDSGGSAINGVLKVGDGVGTSGAAQVVMMQAAQFSSSSSVFVFNTGTVNLAGFSQTFSSISINDGSLTNSGSGATLTLNSSTFPVAFVGGSLNTGTGTLALTAAGSIAVNAADQAVISGNLSLPSGTTTFSVSDGSSLDDLVVSATITGSGSISKTGPGTLLLSGNNNYSGGTSASAGTLALGNANAPGSGTLTISGGTLLANGGNLSIANAVSMTGAFTLGGRSDTTGTNTGIDLTGPVTETGNTTITVDDPAVLAEIDGAISGSGFALTKSGDGTLILTSNNSYSGGATVSAGILNIQSSTALGSGVVSVSSGAALQLQGGVAIGNLGLTLSGIGFVGNIFGTGEGTGAIENVSGANTWGTGTTTITLASATSLGSDSGSLTLDGTVGSSGFAVNKVGLGTIQLAGTAVNSLTGTMTVNDGVLQLNKSPGVDAIEGNLIIGDNQGSGTDTVQELARQQVLDSTAVAVTVNSTGLWDLSSILTAGLSDESQTITISGSPTGGSFTLTYNGWTTAAIADNAPANSGTGNVQSALAALANIGTGDVSVTGNAGGPYVVTFQGTLTGLNVPQITAVSSLTGGTAPTIGIYTSAAGGVAQTIAGPATTIASANTALTLVVGATQSASVTTGVGALALDGSDAVTVGTGNIVVNVRPGITTATAATISGNLDLVAGQLGGSLAATRTVTVAESPATDDLVISANIADGTLTGNLACAGVGDARVVLSGTNTFTGSTTVTTGVLNIQNSAALGAPVDSTISYLAMIGGTSGNFQLAYNGQLTAVMSLGASAATVQNALANLSTIGAGNILVTMSNNVYDFILQGALANGSSTGVTVSSFSVAGTSVSTATGLLVGGGPAGAGTTVEAGAALELQGGVAVASEQLGLLGTGLVGSASTAAGTTNAGSGGLRSTSGNNSWNGSIALESATNSIGVDSGQLTLSGSITGSGAVAEVGAGTLVYSGTSNNSYSGSTYVNAGTLVVDKSVGAAIAGAVLVGNNFGGTDADVLQYGVGATSTEVSGTIFVESSGKLDLATNGASAGNALVTVTGPTSSADVAAGSGGYTGTTITNIALAGTSAASPAAIISGIMPASAVRTITVDRSGASDDLNIAAVISSGSVVKAGWGTLDLSNTNSDGSTTLNANSGTVVVLANGALGAAATTTTVNAGSTLAFRGGVTYSTSESIILNGSGVTATGAATHSGAIDNLGGANSFAGTVTLASASSIGVTAGSLAISGAIGGAFPLTVNGYGTLITTGGITTTSTAVNNATLAGTGSDTGPVTLVTAGTLAPGTGSTPGILNTGSLTLAASGAFSVVLDGSTAGSGYSQTNVSGTVNLAGATLEASLGFVPAAGASFTILTSTSPIVGTFNNLPQGTIASIGGIGFTVEYNASGDNVVLVANSAPTLSGAASLPTILKNTTNPAGTSVSALIASGLSITDANSGAVQGIAVDGANNANGTWQFSLNGGGTWTALGSPTDTSAVLLAANANTLVRFIPNAGYSGTVSSGLTFRAWDQTSGVNGGTADASNNGASTPFSSTTASASILVDAAPTVIGAFVSGSAWNASYLSLLAAAGLGSSALGYELASGANQLTTMVPWTNVTQISIAFSEPVTLSQASLTLYNSANAAISVSSYSYNSSTNIATWQFSAPLAADKYVMNLAANSVSDAAGTALDGAWTTGVSTFAAGSGDGAPGGDFNFYFNVVPGDANSSGSVTNGDVLLTKLQVGAVSNSSNYRDDVNASDNITNGDVLLEKLQVGSNINAFPNPQLPPQSAPAAAPNDATPDVMLSSPSAPAIVSSDDSSGSSVVVISPAAGFVVPTLVPAAQPAPAAVIASTTISPASSTATIPTSTPPASFVSPTSTIVVLAIPLSLSTDATPTAPPVADVLFQSLAESVVPAASTGPAVPALEPGDALALALGSLGQTPSRVAFTPLDDVADNAAPTSLPAGLTSASWTPASPLVLDEIFSAGSGAAAAEFSAVDLALSQRAARLAMLESE